MSSHCDVRLLFLTSFMLLMLFTGLTYPLLGDQKMKVVLSSYPFTTWHKDIVAQDYYGRETVAETKIADMNDTFLKFSGIDPNEEKDQSKIKLLLDFGLDGLRSYTKNRWHPNGRLDHYSEMDRGPRRPRVKIDSWLLGLTNPRFAPIWPKFRQLLAAWARNKRFEPQVMQDLLLVDKKRIDQHYNLIKQVNEEEGKRAKTCAVVGSSGILLNNSYGSLIDSHEMVIRLNNAGLDGAEKFVGSKTTLAFVNSHILHYCSRRRKCFCQPYGVDVPIMLYLCQVQHLMDVAMCSQDHKAPLIVTDARFDNLCYRISKWYSGKRYVEGTGNPISNWDRDQGAVDFHYSSGMQAVMVALGMCEKVNLFGFGKSTTAKHHYHTNQKKELDLHDYEAEYMFYDDLIFNRSSSIPFLSDSGITIPPVAIFR